jgi:hypothetical protein
MFTVNDYRSKIQSLIGDLEHAGADRIAAIPEGSLRVSFCGSHKDADSWDEKTHGAICYVIIEETQPEELLNGRPPTTLCRSNIIPVHGWVVYFFADGSRFHTYEHDFPQCYRDAVVGWLAADIRNQAGGGVDPPLIDDVGTQSSDNYGGSGGHANAGAAGPR